MDNRSFISHIFLQKESVLKFDCFLFLAKSPIFFAFLGPFILFFGFMGPINTFPTACWLISLFY